MLGGTVSVYSDRESVLSTMTGMPRLTYFVCATPRSGSTLLCKSLAATCLAGKPEEHFERLRHSGLPREPREYFNAVDPALLRGGRHTERRVRVQADVELLRRPARPRWDDARQRRARGARGAHRQAALGARHAPRQGGPGGVAVEGGPDPRVERLRSRLHGPRLRSSRDRVPARAGERP